MNAVSGFIFLLSLIAYCHFFPLTEFDIDFQEIQKFEKSYRHCPNNCKEPMEPECQCLSIPHTMNCTGQVIEHGLRKLNLVCNSSDTGTHGTCRILERLKNLVTTDQTPQCLCGTRVSQNCILDYIRRVYQISQSRKL
ncbi:uncharacterized protein LOC117597634 [Pangasianodon hypophthalmus]|uniref:uncharacterized protein LOC117597634 n=1 Tax=Pangasianodon hypophthalmus TaxID=310915 RepID=UPI0023079C42|nr:uncharacterized protein LOC117597634 [Pangasianodon hypophthalmus]